MKKVTFLFAVLLTAGLNNSQAQDTWTQKADFGGMIRAASTAFSINKKGYIGTGWFYDGSEHVYNDFWEYNAENDVWTQKADFGGAPRQAAIGFSIGNRGYIGLGGYYDAGWHFYNDFWEYDPLTNIWTQKANFVSGRIFATGFSIGSKGYVGTGENSTFHNDFWEYDPTKDVWIQKAAFGGAARNNATGFAIGSKGYIGTGYPYKEDFWEYNPVTNIWTQKADFGGKARAAAKGFSIGSKGYIGTGVDINGTDYNDFWEYDVNTDTWIQKVDFGGLARDEAVAFAIGNKGYIGTGYYRANGNFLKDFWQYTPDEDTGCQAPVALKVPFISDTAAVLKWTLPVNPVNEFDIVYHVIGSTPVRKRHATGSTTHIAIGNLLPGTIYRWKIRSDCTADTTKWINGPDFTTTTSATFSSSNTAVRGNDLNGNIGMQILPNPNKGNFTVQMQLPAKAASTTLSLYNNDGIKLWQQNAGMLSGSVNRSIELKSKLTAGVYVLMIQQGDTRLKQKLVVTE